MEEHTKTTQPSCSKTLTFRLSGGDLGLLTEGETESRAAKD